MNSAGLLVARPTRAMSFPAKTTFGVVEGVRDVDDEGLRRLPRSERPVVHLREKEGRDGAPHLRVEPLGVGPLSDELEALHQGPLDEDDAAALSDVREVAVALQRPRAIDETRQPRPSGERVDAVGGYTTSRFFSSKTIHYEITGAGRCERRQSSGGVVVNRMHGIVRILCSWTVRKKAAPSEKGPEERVGPKASKRGAIWSPFMPGERLSNRSLDRLKVVGL